MVGEFHGLLFARNVLRARRAEDFLFLFKKLLGEIFRVVRARADFFVRWYLGAFFDFVLARIRRRQFSRASPENDFDSKRAGRFVRGFRRRLYDEIFRGQPSDQIFRKQFA